MKKLLPFYCLSLIFFLTACASMPGRTPTISSSALNLLRIETAEGEIQPVLQPGDSVELVAVAFNAAGEEVIASPLWSADIGLLDPEEGERVNYIVPEEASTGLAFVTAAVDDVSDTIIIEIQK